MAFEEVQQNTGKSWNEKIGPSWKENILLPCSDDNSNPTKYYLTNANGDEAGYIKCFLETDDQGIGPWRVLVFPEGTFEFDAQVWVPPLTKIVTGRDEDVSSLMTHFRSTFSLYQSKNDLDRANYCKPPISGYNNDGWWEEDKKTPWNAAWVNLKKLRPGFLMHSYTYMKGVGIHGLDRVRPEESGTLCGGGAIETPGCASAYGVGQQGERSKYFSSFIFFFFFFLRSEF